MVKFELACSNRVKILIMSTGQMEDAGAHGEHPPAAPAGEGDPAAGPPGPRAGGAGLLVPAAAAGDIRQGFRTSLLLQLLKEIHLCPACLERKTVTL